LDQLITFVQDRWVVVLVAVVALIVVVKIVKTVLKWVIVLAIVAGLIYYGVSYTDQLKKIGENVQSGAMETAGRIKEEALKTLVGKDVSYKTNPDGSFVVEGKSVRLEGKPGSDKVKLTVSGVSVEVSIDDAIRNVIEAAKKNG
jgi:hypothetical protein